MARGRAAFYKGGQFWPRREQDRQGPPLYPNPLPRSGSPTQGRLNFYQLDT